MAWIIVKYSLQNEKGITKYYTGSVDGPGTGIIGTYFDSDIDNATRIKGKADAMVLKTDLQERFPKLVKRLKLELAPNDDDDEDEAPESDRRFTEITAKRAKELLKLLEHHWPAVVSACDELENAGYEISLVADNEDESQRLWFGGTNPKITVREPIIPVIPKKFVIG